MPIDPTDIVKVTEGAVSSDTFRGTLSDLWQAALGDKIGAWRLARAAELQIKTTRKFDELGLKPDVDRVPERYAITWFEEATKQDEEDIQELFADLLARAASGDRDALDIRNLEILSRLTPVDALLYSELMEGKWGATRAAHTYYWREDRLSIRAHRSRVELAEAGRAFEHLASVGILSRQVQSEEKVNDRSFVHGPRIQTIVRNILVLTQTGLSLHKALTGRGLPRQMSIAEARRLNPDL